MPATFETDIILASANLADETDQTKKFKFDLTGITTATQRTWVLPDASSTFVGTDTTATLTNKTLTAPIISTISNTGTLTLPTSTDTLVGLATSDTLTNKIISDALNTIGANELRTTGASVVIDGAAPPTVGQILKATSATAATWQADVGASQDLNSVLTSGNTTAGLDIVLSGASDTLNFTRNANTLTLDADAALGGNYTLTFPDPTAADSVVYEALTQTLTRKTLNSTLNVITSDNLHSATTTIDVSSAAAPTTNQVLTATSSTVATWQTPTGTATEATVSTTDATVSTIATIATSSNLTYLIRAEYSARGTVSGDCAGYVYNVTYKNIAGTVTLVAQDKLSMEDVVQWDVSSSINTTNIRLEVKGLAATAINWKVQYRIITV